MIKCWNIHDSVEYGITAVWRQQITYYNPGNVYLIPTNLSYHATSIPKVSLPKE